MLSQSLTELSAAERSIHRVFRTWPPPGKMKHWPTQVVQDPAANIHNKTGLFRQILLHPPSCKIPPSLGSPRSSDETQPCSNNQLLQTKQLPNLMSACWCNEDCSLCKKGHYSLLISGNLKGNLATHHAWLLGYQVWHGSDTSLS